MAQNNNSSSILDTVMQVDNNINKRKPDEQDGPSINRDPKKPVPYNRSGSRRGNWKAPENTLNKLKSYRPPTKIESTETSNYKIAIVKEETGADGKIIKPVNLREQYENDATFLKNAISFENIEMMPSGA